MNITLLSWRFFSSRKGRAFFSTLGVALGIMLLVIGQLFLLTIERSNEASIQQKYGNYDMLAGYRTDQHMWDKAAISQLAEMKGIQQTSPILYPYIGEKAAQSELLGLPMYVGLGNDSLAREHAFLKLGEGQLPNQDEVVLPISYMKTRNLSIGDSIDFPFPPEGMRTVTISGTFPQNGSFDMLALFQYDWLASVTGNVDRATVLMIKLTPEASKSEIADELKRFYPELTIDMRSEMATERDNIGGLKPFVQGLTIASFIGSALIVISTLQMAVKERQRELATLRLLGARPRQLSYIVLLESFIIGLLAVLIGTGLGIGVSLLSKNLIGKLMDYPMLAIDIPWSTLSLYAAGCLLFILAVGLIPARAAGKLPPIAAFRQDQQQGDKRMPLATVFSAVVLLIAVLLSASQFLFRWGPVWILLLTGMLFVISLFFSLPLVLQFVVRALSLILRPFVRADGLIAGQSALNQSRRSTQIASIMMLAAIIGISGYMLFESIQQQARQDIQNKFPANYILKAADKSLEPGFSRELYERISRLEGIQALPVSTGLFGLTLNMNPAYLNAWDGQVFTVNGGKQISVDLKAADIEQVRQLGDFKLLEGTTDKSALQNNGVVITEGMKRLGYVLGGEIRIGRFDEIMQHNSTGHTFTIVGVIDQLPVDPGEEFKVYTDLSLMNQYYGIDTYEQILFNIPNASDRDRISNQISQWLGEPEYSNVVLYDRQKELADLQSQGQQRLWILFGTVILMTLVALVGLMNNMAGSIRERNSEFAVLRAMGGLPRQVFRLALLEGVIITCAGGMVGIIAGLTFGYHALAGLEAEIYSFPSLITLIATIVSPIIGLLAALSPALWVSRVNLIRSLYRE